MFLAKAGTYPPAGMFNYKHLLLLLITTIAVLLSAKYTKIKEKQDVKKIIRITTIVIWLLEIIKIIYVFTMGDGNNLNKVVPLYYCSLLLYSGILSSVGKGKLQHIGDVFLATGAIVAGIVFIIFPTTSLPEYPILHFISLHSFFFHGIMIYLGLIIHKSNYIQIQKTDIKYYASLIFVICVFAYIINNKFGSNLMFISQDFPGTPLAVLYKALGKYYTIFMSVAQMTLPFYIIYGLELLKKGWRINNE